MKFNLPVAGAIAAATLITLPAAQAATFSNSIVQDWNNTALEAVKNTRPGGPTQVARSLAIVNTGIFDAWAAYDPVAISTQLPSVKRPVSENTLDNKAEAISYAAYNTLVDQFPTQKTLFDNFMSKLGLEPSNTSSVSAQIGKQAAQAVLNSRRNDGSNEFGNLSGNGIPYSDYSGYTPVNLPNRISNTDPNTILNPDRWQPLILPNGTEQKFFTPYWPKVTPFALESGDQLRPKQGPAKYSEEPEKYIQQAEKIVQLSANLTEEQKALTEYWAAGPGTVTPLGLWNQFTQEVSKKNNYSLDDDAKLFFALNNSLLDASIVGWDTKVAFDSVRPATAIQYLASKGLLPNDGVNFRINPDTGVQEVFAWAGPGKGSQWIPGTEWRPYLGVTPPWAEFVSAHSIFSSSAAETLKLFTGSDAFGGSVTLPKTSTVEPGGFANDITLRWNTFSDAVEQAGISRLYGGIHFDDGNLVGQQLGRETAEVVWKKAQFYIQGGKTIPEPTSVISLLSFGVGIALYHKRKKLSV